MTNLKLGLPTKHRNFYSHDRQKPMANRFSNPEDRRLWKVDKDNVASYSWQSQGTVFLNLHSVCHCWQIGPAPIKTVCCVIHLPIPTFEPQLGYVHWVASVFKKICRWAVTIARWFCLSLTSCSPRLESQAHHLCFFNLYECNSNEKRTKINKKRLGLAHFLRKKYFDSWFPGTGHSCCTVAWCCLPTCYSWN